MRQFAYRCAGARECVSLALDGELSRLERARLHRHLARCPDCRAFAGTVERAVAAVRSAPLETPARPVRVRAPRRPRLWTPVVRLGAPALAAVAIVAAVLPSVSGDGRDRLLRTAPIDLQRDVDAMRKYQRDQRELRIERLLGPSSRPFQRRPAVELLPALALGSGR